MTDKVVSKIKEDKEIPLKVQKRLIYRREALDAAARFRTLPDSKRYVIRFSTGQFFEYYSLIISFLLLGITGLSQSFSQTAAGEFMLMIFGGIDTARQVHHIAAIVLGLQFLYHVYLFFYLYVKWGHFSSIMPAWNDVGHIFQMLKFNLGLSTQYPRFDRYTFEEKISYWTLVVGVVLLGFTGLFQWFPIATTRYLPGWVIPAGRMLHRWEAILLVLFFLIWHSYQSFVKKYDTRMINGMMSIEDMQKNHPLELAYLELAASEVGSKNWPILIEIPLDEDAPLAQKTGTGLPQGSGE